MAANGIITVVALIISCVLSVPSPLDKSVDRLVFANNQLAIGLYKQLTSRDAQNVFFSPFSISTVMGMLYYGARGDTAKALRQALAYNQAGISDSDVHRTFSHLLKNVLRSTSDDQYVLDAANAILVDKSLQVRPEYESAVKDFYQASLRSVDFAGDNAAVLGDINSWVRDKTRGKIDKLLQELSPDAVAVLLNAVYFKGTWKTEFDSERTTDRDFYNNGLESGAKKTPMMYMKKGKMPYLHCNDGYQVLELPYKGDEVSMWIFLPDARDGLANLESKLNPYVLSKVHQQLKETEVHITLPKFKLQYEQDLSAALTKAGAGAIFQPSADFGAMASGGLMVSQVVHKAVVEVNEEGSEAAAVTGVIETRMGVIGDPTPVFRADHPFLFAIVNRRTGMLLFMGRVNQL